jgi:hypothetical protein
MRAITVYQSLSEQICKSIELEYNEQVHQSYFYELMEGLWPKYLQVMLNEMAVELKSKQLRLSEEEFDDMPPSWFDNLSDFPLFEDFLTSDL